MVVYFVPLRNTLRDHQLFQPHSPPNIDPPQHQGCDETTNYSYYYLYYTVLVLSIFFSLGRFTSLENFNCSSCPALRKGVRAWSERNTGERINVRSCDTRTARHNG